MTEVLTGIALVGFVGAWLLATISWVAGLIYGLKAIRRTRPGVVLWSRDTLWNPSNVLLRPDLLTDECRAYRRKCFVATAIFIAAVGIPLLIAAATGALR
jgi:hypothetical protein